MPSFDISEPLNIYDADKAPSQPGLYVWYAFLSIGKPDWNSDSAGGEDVAQANFLQVIKDHSLKFGQQEMVIQALANFSTKWQGVLKEDTASRWEGLDNQNEAKSTTKQDHTRESLIALLNSSFPVFHSPLYLGRAVRQNLRDRLRQHKNHYLYLWDKYSNDKEYIDRISNMDSFSKRAIKLGFCPDDLFFYTLTLTTTDQQKLTPSEINSLIIASEWILNRWATPILGRQ